MKVKETNFPSMGYIRSDPTVNQFEIKKSYQLLFPPTGTGVLIYFPQLNFPPGEKVGVGTLPRLLVAL